MKKNKCVKQYVCKKTFAKHLNKYWLVVKVEESKDGVSDYDTLYVRLNSDIVLKMPRKEYINLAFSDFLRHAPAASHKTPTIKKSQLVHMKPAFANRCEYIDKNGNRVTFGELKLT